MLLVLPTQPAADVTSKRGVNAAILKGPRCYLQRSDFGTQGVDIVCGNGRGGGVPKSSDTLLEQFRFDLQKCVFGDMLHEKQPPQPNLNEGLQRNQREEEAGNRVELKCSDSQTNT
jgi:hypothetical protein